MGQTWRTIILLSAAAFLPTTATPGEENNSRFRYDATLRKCSNQRGDEGLNRPAKSKPDNECADYRGKLIIYFQAEDGNFRGANFDGAQYRYSNLMARADFTGARMTNIVGDSADFGDANFSGADFTGAQLKPCLPNGGGFCMPGARFDAATILPFSREEALARGMASVDESK